MINNSNTFQSIPNRSNLIAKNIEILLFILVVVLISVSLKNENNLLDKIIKSGFLIVIIFFQTLHFKRLFQEPAFLSIANQRLTIRPSFYILKKRISASEIKGYSLITRPYYLNHGRIKFKYSAYLLYLKNGNKLIITEYYFINFNLVSSALRKAGINFLGKEDSDWTLFKRKYRYD